MERMALSQVRDEKPNRDGDGSEGAAKDSLLECGIVSAGEFRCLRIGLFVHGLDLQ
jgi:hypothetical protein